MLSQQTFPASVPGRSRWGKGTGSQGRGAQAVVPPVGRVRRWPESTWVCRWGVGPDTTATQEGPGGRGVLDLGCEL